MKLPLGLFACAALLASLAMPASATYKPTGGIIKTGPIVSPCKTNPKSCGVGYDPLKKPHVPKAPQ